MGPSTLLFCTLLLQDPAPAPAPDGRALALLERMQSALGRAAADAGGLRMRGRAAWANLEGSGRTEELYGALGQAHLWTEFENFGRFELGVAEGAVWERSPLELSLRSGWEGALYARRFAVASNAPWEALYADARQVGEEELDGRSCAVLELQPRWILDGEPPAALGEEPAPSDRWWIDRETALPARVLFQARAAGGSELQVDVRFADWRQVGAERFAHRRQVGVSGFTLELEFETIARDPALDSERFALPEDVLAAVAERARGADETAPRVLELESRHVAALRVSCPAEQLQQTFAVILPECLRHVTAQGASMTGPPLVRYHSWGDTHDVEACIPVAEPVEEGGRVRARTLPAGPAVVAWHIGPYHTLGETHERIQAYLAEHELEQSDVPWEEYWTDPGMEPDASRWRTRVVWPVRAADGVPR